MISLSSARLRLRQEAVSPCRRYDARRRSPWRTYHVAPLPSSSLNTGIVGDVVTDESRWFLAQGHNQGAVHRLPIGLNEAALFGRCGGVNGGARPHATVTRGHRESGVWDAMFRSERPFVAGRAVRIERRQQFGVLDQMP